MDSITTPEIRGESTLGRIGILAVLLASYIGYARTLHFNFAYDDFLIIVFNPRVHSLHFLWSYFTQQVWAQVGNGPGNLYRPLFMTWLLANYEAFGLSPAGWHFTSVLTHLLATLLVYRLARKLIPGSPLPALIAGAVFGLHPIHVEAVAWISGVTEPLAACFFLGSFLCFIRFREGVTGSWAWLALSLVLFAGAAFSKETTIVLPALIAVYEFCFRRDQSVGEWVRSSTVRIVPYVAIAGLYLATRSSVLHGMAHPISDVGLRTSVLTLPWVVSFYISQTLAPIGLGPFYDINYTNAVSTAGLLLPAAVLLVFAIGVLWWTRKSHSYVPLFLAGWFLLTLLPAFGVFLLMPRYEGVHDRYLYLPSAAFALLVGYTWKRVFPSAKTSLQIAIGVLLLVLLTIATRHQAAYWENDLVLFTRAKAVAPHNPLAKLNLAAELIRRGRFENASGELQSVIAQNPQMGVAFSLAAKSAYFLGDYSRAENYYARSLQLSPAEPEQIYYLGLSHIKMGEYSQGLSILLKGLSLWPSSPGYHYAIGLAYAGMGEWRQARDEYKLELGLSNPDPAAGPALQQAQERLAQESGSFSPAR